MKVVSPDPADNGAEVGPNFIDFVKNHLILKRNLVL